ncbi:MAG: NUDIX hydrolase [Bacteroidales bacterium]|jgi:8-oxo-dGTP pyrophosphatase MutT (NUDIX family)|nr:NUDIX hydrolase [Bacteroidales bacterium]
MKNFPFEHEGETLWFSRAVAVTGLVYKHNADKTKTWVLANKRGQGTPDFQGYWNLPCGYLDFDENGQEAVAREVLEETGYKTRADGWHFVRVSTDPKENRQNVSILYRYHWNEQDDETVYRAEGGEQDEVEDVKWVDIDEADKYQWAFCHDRILRAFGEKIGR